MKPSFRLLEHTADMGIGAQGASQAELFVAAAMGLRQVLTAQPGHEDVTLPIRVTADGLDELLVNWLQEILYLLECRRFLASSFAILNIGETHLEARLAGEILAPGGPHLDREVKAVTFHRLHVAQQDGVWKATVYLDL